MSWLVRRAQAADMAATADIVNAHIAAGVAHFADRPQVARDWLANWEAARERYPWLVAERDAVIVGLAYANRFNSRAAYDWTAETTVYVRAGMEGQGVGTALYRRLLEILDAQGYRCLIAGITLPNEASVALHETFGFEYVGTLERVGYKFGAWRDVGTWQREVGPDNDTRPPPVRSVDEVTGPLGS